MITKDNYKDFYILYIQEDDPTEYSFVKKYIGTMEQWDDLCTTLWFRPIVLRWRREIETKIKSKALRALREVAQGDNTRDSFVANRYLLDGNWREENNKNKRGRPSKREIQEETKRMVEEDNKLKQDWDNIFK